jgi:hypothetical protein
VQPVGVSIAMHVKDNFIKRSYRPVDIAVVELDDTAYVAKQDEMFFSLPIFGYLFKYFRAVVDI